MTQAQEQRRAWHATSKVETYLYDAPVEDRDRYRSRARQLPGMLQHWGLGGTLAFLIAKGTPEREPDPAHPEPPRPDMALADHLADWLLSHAGLPWPAGPIPGGSAALQLVRRIADQHTGVEVYALAAAEAQRYAAWLKRWSTALVLGGVDAG